MIMCIVKISDIVLGDASEYHKQTAWVPDPRTGGHQVEPPQPCGAPSDKRAPLPVSFGASLNADAIVGRRIVAWMESSITLWFGGCWVLLVESCVLTFFGPTLGSCLRFSGALPFIGFRVGFPFFLVADVSPICSCRGVRGAPKTPIHFDGSWTGNASPGWTSIASPVLLGRFHGPA